MTGNVKVKVAPRSLPPTLAGLGVVTGYAPKPADQLRMYLVGPSGGGKTTFLSSIPDTIILDFEDGAVGIPGTVAHRVKVKGYDHYMKVTDALIADASTGRQFFKRVAIDTVEEWVETIILQLQAEKGVEDITEHGSRGHGWAMIRNRCWHRLRELENAGYAWTCVGHLKEKTIDDPKTGKEKTVLRPAVFDSFSGQIIRQAEIYSSCYSENTTKEPEKVETIVGGRKVMLPPRGVPPTIETTYFLDFQTVPGREGKLRGVPSLRERIELPRTGGWDEFVSKYNEAVQKDAALNAERKEEDAAGQ